MQRRFHGGLKTLTYRKAIPMATTRQIGRDARTGQIIPVREAHRRPSTTVVETVPVRKPATPSKPKGK
jgi:hypothetical protein